MVMKGNRFVVYRTKDDKRWRWNLYLSHYGNIAMSCHHAGYATREGALQSTMSAVTAFRGAVSDGEVRVQFSDRYRFRRR